MLLQARTSSVMSRPSTITASSFPAVWLLCTPMMDVELIGVGVDLVGADPVFPPPNSFSLPCFVAILRMISFSLSQSASRPFLLSSSMSAWIGISTSGPSASTPLVTLECFASRTSVIKVGSASRCRREVASPAFLSPFKQTF